MFNLKMQFQTLHFGLCLFNPFRANFQLRICLDSHCPLWCPNSPKKDLAPTPQIRTTQGAKPAETNSNLKVHPKWVIQAQPKMQFLKLHFLNLFVFKDSHIQSNEEEPDLQVIQTVLDRLYALVCLFVFFQTRLYLREPCLPNN